MSVAYSAFERFDASIGESWSKFVAWSGLTQLREVISLDGILCPTVFRELTDEDWQHNVKEDSKLHLMHDPDYVSRKVAGNDRVNVLAVAQDPTDDEIALFSDPRFAFRGFDLLDGPGGISALVNCGGFHKAFANGELSEYGLILNHRRAVEVQRLLRENYPHEHHAVCDLWVIWQMIR